jgi:predicted 3-demethylubiquinone-9 3-methyltransferase (glyoxalase superfamily)
MAPWTEAASGSPLTTEQGEKRAANRLSVIRGGVDSSDGRSFSFYRVGRRPPDTGETGSTYPPLESQMPRITIAPCLWFDDEAEEAARLYTSIFPDSRIVRITRYGKEGHEHHGRPEGSVMTVDFELDGQPMTALNGGPHFTFNEAVSLQVICEDPGEVDHFWDALGEGGDPDARQCGWLKDRYGVSWQVVPRGLAELISSPESEACQRAMRALLRMEKLDLAAIRRAYEGGEEASRPQRTGPR